MRRFRETALKTTAGIGIIAALLLPASFAAAQEIVTLQTREGVTQTFLLSTPINPPHAVAILFPGSEGNIRLRSEGGQIKLGEGNFLVRSRNYFVDGRVATAVMDSPSDQATGMNDGFRLGDKHATDIATVVAELQKRYADTPVFLVGTSRGTLSAAAAGRALSDRVAGVVLTATMFNAARSGQGLSGFDFTTIRPPVLFVHHADDGCNVTPYRGAKSLSAKFPLITVQGGEPARSDPCEAFSAHGFLGKERETVEAMVNWMLKKPYRSNID
ncbi:MAG: alpha/beta hydrolase [Betaproteobacteria bacterium]|nr:alpha/beta hydrolase [Betaproteobacteria bacterium]